MTERQTNIFIKRFAKLQRWEQASWLFLNLAFALLSVYAKMKSQPGILWALIILVLFLGPSIFKSYAKKQRLMLQNNLVNLPPGWDKRLSIFTHLAGWEFVLILGLGLSYLLPMPLAYSIIILLYLGSWAIEWLKNKKRRETLEFLLFSQR